MLSRPLLRPPRVISSPGSPRRLRASSPCAVDRRKSGRRRQAWESLGSSCTTCSTARAPSRPIWPIEQWQFRGNVAPPLVCVRPFTSPRPCRRNQYGTSCTERHGRPIAVERRQVTFSRSMGPPVRVAELIELPDRPTPGGRHADPSRTRNRVAILPDARLPPAMPDSRYSHWPRRRAA